MTADHNGTALALGLVSAISVALIVLDKRQRPSGRWRAATFAALLVWALALPFFASKYLDLPRLDLRAALLVGLLVVVAAYANQSLARHLGWDLSHFDQRLAIAMQTPWRTCALMVIVAPVCEECIFRGFLLEISLAWGIVAALAFTTSLFVAVHTDWASVPHLTIAGLLFAALAITSGGLAGPIAAHATANLLGFVALRMSARRDEKA
jgi:membrane protease YdiL (CAAX protease family)